MHSYEDISSFNLYDYIDHVVESSGRISVGSRYSIWPTDASTIVTINNRKKIAGACQRAVFYRVNNVPQTDPINRYIQYVFELGKVIEKMHIEKIKISGLYRASNLKFWNEELQMSGELDLISGIPNDPEKLVICELKTSYGYQAESEFFDSKSGAGRPKPEHVMQIASYLYSFRDNPKIVGGKILYFLRDNTKHTEFNIHLQLEDKIWYIYINNQKCIDFTYSDVITRFKLFHKLAKSKVLPERDYSLVYDDEQMKTAHIMGDITDKAMKAFTDNPINSNRKGDWRCNGCNWKTKCYSENPGIE